MAKKLSIRRLDAIVYAKRRAASAEARRDYTRRALAHLAAQTKSAPLQGEQGA